MDALLLPSPFPKLYSKSLFFDLKRKCFIKIPLLFKVFGNILMLGVTLCSFTKNDPDLFSKTHDVVVNMAFISADLILMTKKEQLTEVFRSLDEPLIGLLSEPSEKETVKRFYKIRGIISVMSFGYVFLVNLTWFCTETSFLFPSPPSSNPLYIKMASAWMPAPADHHEIVLLLKIFSLALTELNIFSMFAWYLTYHQTVLMIKVKVKLLSYAISTLDEKTRVFSRVTISRLESNLDLPLCKGCQQRWFRRALGEGPGKCCVSAELQEITEGYLKKKLKSIADRHMKVLRIVRHTNSCAYFVIYVFNHLSVLLIVLAIPYISSISSVASREFLHSAAESLGLLAFIAFSNVSGQIIVDESETLRRAIRNMSWVDMPERAQRSVAVIRTVAEGGLCQTNGLVQLKHDSLAKILQAICSFAIVLQSMKNEEQSGQ